MAGPVVPPFRHVRLGGPRAPGAAGHVRNRYYDRAPDVRRPEREGLRQDGGAAHGGRRVLHGRSRRDRGGLRGGAVAWAGPEAGIGTALWGDRRRAGGPDDRQHQPVVGEPGARLRVGARAVSRMGGRLRLGGAQARALDLYRLRLGGRGPVGGGLRASSVPHPNGRGDRRGDGGRSRARPDAGHERPEQAGRGADRGGGEHARLGLHGRAAQPGRPGQAGPGDPPGVHGSEGSLQGVHPLRAYADRWGDVDAAYSRPGECSDSAHPQPLDEQLRFQEPVRHSHLHIQQCWRRPD